MTKTLHKEESHHRADKNAYILWFDRIGADDGAIVGGKNANLGEMYRNLTKKGVRVPNGFAITSTAYKHLLAANNAEPKMRDILEGLNTHNVTDLATRGQRIRELIRGLEFPPDLHKEIKEAYERLCKEYGENTDVAVRSSATAEDLPTASFAGQQETYLNIRGLHELIDSCKKCFASLFTNRAISYRVDKGFDHFKVYLSIGVQKMVRSDKACSGVMFTLDTETGFPDVILINASYGLGENIVQGAVTPDEYYIHKPTLQSGFRPIIKKHLGDKTIKMIYTMEGNKPTKNVDVAIEDRELFCLTDDEALQLAKWGIAIEEHYSTRNRTWMPMDIEWAKDGNTGDLYIVQARAETVQSQKDRRVLEEYHLLTQGDVLCTGAAVGAKIATGEANIIKDVKDISKFKAGQVLVTEMTDPDWEPIMKMAAGIVTNRGGRTCHSAIVSRELGIPCIVGTNNGTDRVKAHKPVTVDCSSGDVGRVLAGKLPYDIKKTDLSRLDRPRTKIMVNLGNPDQAFEASFLPVDGVGLAREEFIINSAIQIHPNALIHYPNIDDEAKEKIDELTKGYKDKKEYYIEKLSQGVGTICAAMYPRDVIIRLADFKSNEYANLIGGRAYEPREDNPMIGWRGASRFYSDDYKEAFALECEAIRRVRDKMGLRNLNIMIPMCRTIDEGKRVIAEMKKNGLVQGKNNLQIYVMCEVPANVILAEEFCEIFDGFSIGSNDLTQFTLAVDRDSQLVAHIFDERNPAVKKLVKQMISVAKAKHRKIGICGDAPSTYPEFAAYLVECGIDSISLSPDAVLKTMRVIVDTEKRGLRPLLNPLKNV
ncbi:phosphoenolpyruvate synthase [Candidatus Woesearchaeota archaeon]|nr:phosphoenolpyruvate synthase [Candidatus Woesearchaeota archaeon]